MVVKALAGVDEVQLPADAGVVFMGRVGTDMQQQCFLLGIQAEECQVAILLLRLRDVCSLQEVRQLGADGIVDERINRAPLFWGQQLFIAGFRSCCQFLYLFINGRAGQEPFPLLVILHP